MPSPIDARLLSTFRVVVATGGVSAAAQAIHLSQPAVSAQVRQLEEQCGRPLLVRSARGVTPTEAGRRMAACADGVQALLDEAAAAIGADTRAGEPLVIAASTTIAAHVLPRLLADFVREAGARRLQVRVGNTDEVMRLVADGEVPLGLVEGHSRAPRLRLEKFLEDELVPMAASSGVPELLRLRRARQLLDTPLILRERGSGTRAIVERALRSAAGRRRPHAHDVEIGDTSGVKAACIAGLGVAFLSLLVARDEVALGRLRVLPIRDLTIGRRFSWALPAGEVSGVAGRFLRFARLTAAGLRAP